MRKILLLFFAIIGLVPQIKAVSAVLKQPTRVKGHVITHSEQKRPEMRLTVNMNPLRAAAVEGGMTLDESFETGSYDLPEGWSADLTNENDWYVACPIMSGITPTEGYYSAAATCWKLHDASWLVSPDFTPREGEQLMFDLYFDVRSLYVWTIEGDDKNIDEEDGLILNRVNAENFKVCISVDGGDWVELKDLWKEYGDLGYHMIMDEYAEPEYRPFAIPLDKYVGKNVKLGFCHQYLDSKGGYGMFLDAVKVGLPPVKPYYMLPFETLFWGISNDFSGMVSEAIMPLYTEMTWENYSTEPDLKFGWEYSLFNSGKLFTSSDDNLITVFKPDYSENPELSHTIYSFPTLTATNGAGTKGSYTYADGNGHIFAGAEAALPSREGEKVQFGLSTFDVADDFQIYNCDFSTPAWGYNSMTTDWWTDHFFHGAQEAGDKVEVTSNINFFYAPGTPLVIDGVRVAASTECEDDAEFKMQLVEMNEDFMMCDVLAEATVKGADLVKIDPSEAPFPNTVMLCFKFEKPVVIDGKNFVARLSGFNSKKVTNYSPLQSWKNADMCHGFASLDITAPSIGQSETREQLMAASLDGNYTSFAMFLDGVMPWLVCEDTEFEATKENPGKVFEFDSSYSAEDLTVTSDGDGGLIPEWIEIKKSGRYGNTRLTVTVTDGSQENEMVILTVSAPGVSKNLTVKRGNWHGGLIDITADASRVVEQRWFDLSGRHVNSEPANGIYIIRNVHADGSVTTEKVMRNCLKNF